MTTAQTVNEWVLARLSVYVDAPGPWIDLDQVRAAVACLDEMAAVLVERGILAPNSVPEAPPERVTPQPCSCGRYRGHAGVCEPRALDPAALAERLGATLDGEWAMWPTGAALAAAYTPESLAAATQAGGVELLRVWGWTRSEINEACRWPDGPPSDDAHRVRLSALPGLVQRADADAGSTPAAAPAPMARVNEEARLAEGIRHAVEAFLELPEDVRVAAADVLKPLCRVSPLGRCFCGVHVSAVMDSEPVPAAPPPPAAAPEPEPGLSERMRYTDGHLGRVLAGTAALSMGNISDLRAELAEAADALDAQTAEIATVPPCRW